MTTTTDMTVSKTILQQLGNNKFIAMTGAKNFIGSANTLSFQLPGRFAAKGINGVRIELKPDDTYTVTFLKSKKYDLITISTHDNIYCDGLRELFERVTGLRTRL